MFEVGRLAVKIAGRDSGQKCVVVDILDGKYVMIDGLTRRRKCSITHLEPLDEIIKVKKGASHSDVKAAFKKLGIEIVDKKPKKAAKRPRKARKSTGKKAAEEEPAKKEAKKDESKEKKPEAIKAETKKPEAKKPAKKDVAKKAPAKKSAAAKKTPKKKSVS